MRLFGIKLSRDRAILDFRVPKCLICYYFPSNALWHPNVKSTMSSRKDELLAKKARLAELRRQRELRQEQYTSSRQSIGEV